MASSHVALADTNTQPCASGKSDCSSGTAVLHAESREPVISSIATGWMPKCDVPDAQGHCGSEQPIQVQASIDLAALPSPSKEPLWSIDMPKGAVIDVSWPTTKSFELSAPTSPTDDGTFKVTHTLIPQVHLYVGALGLGLNWTYSAQKFLEQYAANYKYKATNTQAFAPWAMPTPVVNLVPAPPVTETTLLSTKLINDAKNDIDIALAAKTSPKFSYRTTSVVLATTSTIAADTPTITLPMEDADFLDLPVDVTGEITVEGVLSAAPYVKINKINGLTFPFLLDLSNATDLDYPYTSATPVTVKFPEVTVHVPLPNVKAPRKAVDLGAVTIGENVDKKVSITNSGELGATLAFTSSDKQFKVVKSATADAKNEYELTITFEPTNEGQQSATITVTSNDPDSPEQTFEVRAVGTAAEVATTEPTSTEGEVLPASDSGCSCRTASQQGTPAAGLIALSGLVGVLALRRRRLV